MAAIADIVRAVGGWAPELLGDLLKLIEAVASKPSPRAAIASLARIAAHETATDAALEHMKVADVKTNP